MGVCQNDDLEPPYDVELLNSKHLLLDHHVDHNFNHLNILLKFTE